MGHGWTIVGCNFFPPPLGAPPVIFKPEDSTELTLPHLTENVIFKLEDSTELTSPRRERAAGTKNKCVRK